MSSDELANFDMPSPQVAGPSTLPSNKRKTAPDSKKSGPVARKKPSQRREETIELSSENEQAPPPPPPRQKARRGKATSVNVAVNGHANGRSAPPSKRNGKSPPPVSPSEKIIANGKDTDRPLSESVDEDEPRPERKTLPHSSSDKSKADVKSMTRLQKMYDDAVKQRDEFARQFEQLSQLRNTDAEKLLHEQQLQYEARLKAQQESIHELQISFNRLDTLPSSGKGPLHFLTREVAERERQDVQREVSKLRNTLKEKDTLLNEKDQELIRLNDEIKTTRRELDMEVENSKRIASRATPASLSKTSSNKLDPRNALILRVYEALTGILITNVKHDPGKFKDDDAIFTCVQTTRNGNSLQFTLKYTTTDTNGDGLIEEKVVYTPLNLDMESPAFIEQLDFLAKPFTFQKDQMQVFSHTLTSHLEGNNGDDNDTSRMEE